MHYVNAFNVSQECIPVGCIPAARWPYAAVCSWGGGGCLLWGGCIPACSEADTLPRRGQNSWHTLVKILPWPNFVATGNEFIASGLIKNNRILLWIVCQSGPVGASDRSPSCCWWPILSSFFHNSRIIGRIEQKLFSKKIRGMTRDWTQITCLTVRHFNHYTWMFSVLVVRL